MKKAVLAVTIVLVAALVCQAQDYKGKARQGGVVFDDKGAPLEGVNVKLFSVRAQQGFEVKTDKNGKWMAAWIRSGGWTITFEKIGYAPQNITVNVQETSKNPDVTAIMIKVEGLALTDEIKALLIQGNADFELKKFDEARASYEQIIAKYPDAYIIYGNIGNCYFSQEKYDQAEQAYLKVLEKAPGDTNAIIAIGNCYSNRGDAAKALEWYGKVEFEKIEDPIVLYNLGTSYYNNSKFEDALKFYLKAVEKQKDSPDALYQLGLTHLNLQKNAEAITAFEDYLKIDPDSPRAAQVKAFIEYLKKK
ncbi:MAG: tetratricopeptide repeat protein [Candidatus Aminicenantes bacterium]|nr:tetratricopeptide repeat protein [Candidatus Aminicenantes bacterium]